LPGGWTDEFLKQVKKGISNKDLEILNNDIDLGHQRTQQFESNMDFFGPDGLHPNSHAQEILFEFLLEKIPNLRR